MKKKKEETKVCIVCGEIVPLDKMAKNKLVDGSYSYRDVCQKCVNAQQRERRRKLKEDEKKKKKIMEEFSIIQSLPTNVLIGELIMRGYKVVDNQKQE